LAATQGPLASEFLWQTAWISRPKAVVICATKVYKETGGIAALLYDICTGCRWLVSLPLLPPYPRGKNPLV